MLVAEIKGKQALYQTMIKEKDHIIEELRLQTTIKEATPAKATKSQKKQRVQEESEDQ